MVGSVHACRALVDRPHLLCCFLLGATTSKDFSDMEGDAAHGCRTLPIPLGVTRAARFIAPFFVLPWLLIPLGAFLPNPLEGGRLLTGDRCC